MGSNSVCVGEKKRKKTNPSIVPVMIRNHKRKKFVNELSPFIYMYVHFKLPQQSCCHFSQYFVCNNSSATTSDLIYATGLLRTNLTVGA